MRQMKWVGCLLVASMAFSNCSSDDAAEESSPANEVVPGTKLRGTVSSATESGTLDLTVAAEGTQPKWSPLATSSAALDVSGTFTPDHGTAIPLSGSFDPQTGTLTVRGSGYQFIGSAHDGTFAGAYTGPHGSGTFVLLSAASAPSQLFCGTFAGSQTGNWTITASPNGAAVGTWSSAAGQAGTFAGTWRGSALSVTGDPISAQGSLAATGGTGTWSSPSGSGTWSTSACAAGAVTDAGSPPAEETGPAPGPDGGAHPDAAHELDASDQPETAVVTDASTPDVSVDTLVPDGTGGDAAVDAPLTPIDVAADSPPIDAGSHPLEAGSTDASDAGSSDDAPATSPGVCTPPVCQATGPGNPCSCTRHDSDHAFALVCDGANCHCNVDGFDYNSWAQTFTSPNTCNTTSTAEYVMAKYCGCALPNGYDAGTAGDGSADSGSATADADGSTTADSAPADGASSDASDGAAACNNITSTFQHIPDEDLNYAFPASAATGGTFHLGTYGRAKSVFFTGASGHVGLLDTSHTETLVLSGSTQYPHIERYDVVNNAYVQTASYSLDGNGATVYFNSICPAGTPLQTYGYTASTSMFTLYESSTGHVIDYAWQN